MPRGCKRRRDFFPAHNKQREDEGGRRLPASGTFETASRVAFTRVAVCARCRACRAPVCVPPREGDSPDLCDTVLQGFLQIRPCSCWSLLVIP